MQPQIKFFCELPPSDLQVILQDGRTIHILKALQAGICLGLLDFSDERAQIVRSLNQAEIPLTAWILLPEDKGYWSNIDNAAETAERYQRFSSWVVENGLRFEAVGLDLSPSIEALQVFFRRDFKRLGSLIRKALIPGRYRSAKRIYRELIQRIHADGYFLEVYQYPWIVDERIAQSRWLQWLFGLVDLPSDREVLKCYTSLLDRWGPGVIWSYGEDSDAIAIGSTGGGSPWLERFGTPLQWETFESDLLRAWRWSACIYVYTLEGCYQRNLLERILAVEWDKPILEPQPISDQVARWRISLQVFLGLTTFLPLFVISGVLIFTFIHIRRKKANYSSFHK